MRVSSGATSRSYPRKFLPAQPVLELPRRVAGRKRFSFIAQPGCVACYALFKGLCLRGTVSFLHALRLIRARRERNCLSVTDSYPLQRGDRTQVGVIPVHYKPTSAHKLNLV